MHYYVFRDLDVPFFKNKSLSIENFPSFNLTMRDPYIHNFHFNPTQSGILMSDATQTININNVEIFLEADFYLELNFKNLLENQTEQVDTVSLKYNF